MKKASNKPYHLLVYVEDSSPKLKRFSSTLTMGKFIDKFEKKHPGQEAVSSGYWIDYTITGVTGDVFFFMDGMKIT